LTFEYIGCIINSWDECDLRIPTEAELSKLCKAGRNTVREAVSSLVHEGLLKKIQGSGTFVTSELDPSYSRKGNLVGIAASFTNDTIEVFNSIQDYVLDKDGLMTIYNVAEDSQDPKKERRFLEKAERENCAGLIVLPSPIEPFNAEIYKRLRNKGIKVALIAPYQEDMSEDVTFFYDYFHAGYVSVVKMAMAGFKRICFARILLPVSYKWIKDGIRQATEDLGLELLDDYEFRCGANHIEHIARLPRKTGIIAAQTSVGNELYNSIVASEFMPGEDIALCVRSEYLKEGYSEISCLTTPRLELFKAAIDYIFDPEIDSMEIIHKTFNFKYEERGTVEKV
jgi:DNA-binding LacI/PurR family transcriptional regulator